MIIRCSKVFFSPHHTCSLFSQHLPKALHSYSLTAAFSKLRAKWPTVPPTSRVSTQAHRAEMGLPRAHILLTTVCNASPKAPTPFSLLFSRSPGADTQVNPQVRPVFWLCGTNSFLLCSGYLLWHQVIRPLLPANRWKRASLCVSWLACWKATSVSDGCHFYGAPQLLLGVPAACPGSWGAEGQLCSGGARSPSTLPLDSGCPDVTKAISFCSKVFRCFESETAISIFTNSPSVPTTFPYTLFLSIPCSCPVLIAWTTEKTKSIQCSDSHFPSNFW